MTRTQTDYQPRKRGFESLNTTDSLYWDYWLEVSLPNSMLSIMNISQRLQKLTASIPIYRSFVWVMLSHSHLRFQQNYKVMYSTWGVPHTLSTHVLRTNHIFGGSVRQQVSGTPWSLQSCDGTACAMDTRRRSERVPFVHPEAPCHFHHFLLYQCTNRLGEEDTTWLWLYLI